MAAAGSDKVTASEAWNLLLLQFYFQDCSGSSPLCFNTASSKAKPHSRSSKVLKGPHQDLAGTDTVPLVSGDMGGKKDSISSTPGAHLWVPAVQGRNRPGVRIKPFPSQLLFAAAAQESSPTEVAVGVGGLVALERSPSSPWQARGRARVGTAACQAASEEGPCPEGGDISWCDEPLCGPGGVQEAPKMTRERFCLAAVLPCCLGATTAVSAVPPPTPCPRGFLGFV